MLWRIGKALGLTAVIAYSFYRSYWGFVLFPLIYWWIHKRDMKLRRDKERSVLYDHFMDSLKLVNSSLLSGMSMENAWKDAEIELKALHGPMDIMVKLLETLNKRVQTNEPMEAVWLELAQDSNLEEIQRFAEILSFGKKSGANWKELIHKTVLRMEEKYDTSKQIEVLLAQKRLEQKIMNLMPLGIILFLSLTTGDYLDVLYHNVLGVGCMSLCLAIYGVAFGMAEQLQRKVLHYE